MFDGPQSAPVSDAQRARALLLIDRQPRQDETELVDWLSRLCLSLATDVGVAGAAITLSPEGGAGEPVAAASDAASRRVAELGFAVGEGPAVDALLSGRPVLVPLLGGPLYGSWPGYTSAATDLGVCAAFCFPLQVGAVRFGVLSVFAAAPTELGTAALGTCLTMAALATERLLDSAGQTHSGELEPDLDNALSFHSEIYQAQGMVAVALDITLAQALSRMRGHAFVTDRQLLEIAVDIVEGQLRLPDDRSTT
ncbi:ANTAR domain-containing protein [soil metagenome]